MSVLVMDMEMPNSCDGCRLRAIALARCQITMKSTSHFPTGKPMDQTKRPKWCPLVGIPEKHGRLIDADKLMDDVKKNSASYFADDFAREWVDVQPTVIEAEGE